MKKLKNIFLLVFLILFSIFLGSSFSLFMNCYTGNIPYYSIDYMTSAVEDNIKFERNYFKSKNFSTIVTNNILKDLKFSVADESNYSDNTTDSDFRDDLGNIISEKENIKLNKKYAKESLEKIEGIKYFAINNTTKEVLTNTEYKTFNEFKNRADGYYQIEFKGDNLVNRKIDNVNYGKKDNGSVNDFYYDIENSMEIDTYISISKDAFEKDNVNYYLYGYDEYQNMIKQYDRCVEIGIPTLISSIIFLLIYGVMNFKLPKTKREFWNYYNKIPLELIVLFLVADISIIFALGDPNIGMRLNQFCVIPIFILLFYFILLIKQISNFEKKKNFFKTSWIFRIICFLLKKIKIYIKETRELIIKSQKFDIINKIVVMAIICVILELVAIFLMYAFDVILLGVLIFIIQLGFLIYLVKRLSYLKEIMDGVHRIKEGQVNYKIDLKDDLYFKNFAIDINNIGQGLENSIENRLKSERMKSELITNVSHDLKTPLTSIINYVELIKKEENLTPDYLKDYVNVLDKKSQRLKILIEDLFEASKASTGNIELELIKIDLKQLLRQSIGELEEKLEDAKLSLRINLTEEDTFVLADGRRLYRVFENLLSNISKYSLENTRVYIDLEKVDGKIITTMKNISSYELNFNPEEIMERFKRADESRNTEGSGLGLAIARDLVKLQGGNINIDIDGDLFKVIVEMDEYKPVNLYKEESN